MRDGADELVQPFASRSAVKPIQIAQQIALVRQQGKQPRVNAVAAGAINDPVHPRRQLW